MIDVSSFFSPRSSFFFQPLYTRVLYYTRQGCVCNVGVELLPISGPDLSCLSVLLIYDDSKGKRSIDLLLSFSYLKRENTDRNLKEKRISDHVLWISFRCVSFVVSGTMQLLTDGREHTMQYQEKLKNERRQSDRKRWRRQNEIGTKIKETKQEKKSQRNLSPQWWSMWHHRLLRLGESQLLSPHSLSLRCSTRRLPSHSPTLLTTANHFFSFLFRKETCLCAILSILFSNHPSSLDLK